MSYNAAKLSLANQAALENHHIDVIVREMHDLPHGTELDPERVVHAQLAQEALIEISEEARLMGVVTLEEMVFTDREAYLADGYPHVECDPED